MSVEELIVYVSKFLKIFNFPITIASRKMGDDVSRDEKKWRMAQIVDAQKNISYE